jgi:hypothetical protein
MRNNEDRVGVADPIESGSDSAAATQNFQQSINQLNFVVPTELVDLPSKGVFYDEHHPLHNKEDVEIKLMTAKDEDTLSSKSLIKKGIVIDRLIQDLLVNKSIRPEDLLSCDKNAIMVAARRSGYGQDYTTKVTCPNCSLNQEYTFDLNECAHTYFNDPNNLPEGVKRVGVNMFCFSLPVSKFEWVVKLMTGREEQLMTQKQLTQQKGGKDTYLLDVLRSITVSISGVSDAKLIEKAIELMPIKDYKLFKERLNIINPRLELKSNFNCLSCDYSTDLEVPFTTDFFWPKR